jgi:hypothetical protein
MGRHPIGMDAGTGYARGPPRPPSQSRDKEATAERRRQCLARMSPGQYRHWLLWRKFMDRYDPMTHATAVKRIATRATRWVRGKKNVWKVGDQVAASLWMQPGPGLKLVHVYAVSATVLSTFQSNVPHKPKAYAVLRIPRKYKRTVVVVAADQCIADCDYVVTRADE